MDMALFGCGPVSGRGLMLTTPRLRGLAQSGNGALAHIRLDQTLRDNP
jgi:hypothetical protein